MSALSAVVLSGCERRAAVLPTRVEILREGPVSGPDVAAVDVPVRPGGRYLARLERFGFEGRLALADAANRTLVQVGSPSTGRGRQYLFWTARDSTPVRVHVTALPTPARSARFRLQVYALPEALAERDVAAFEALTRALRTDRARDDATKASVRADLAAAEEAWRGRDPRLAADVAFQLASFDYYLLDDWRQVVDGAERAAHDYAALADAVGEADARALAGLARLEYVRELAGSDPARARRCFDEASAAFDAARALYVANDLPVEAAKTLSYRAVGSFHLSDLPAAIESLRAAEQALATAGADRERTVVLGNLATLRSESGDYTGASREYDRLLPLLRDRRDENAALVLQNAASIGLYVGDFGRSLDRYLESLSIAREIGVARAAGFALLGLGVTHLYLGQPDVARGHLEAALAALPDSEIAQRVHAELRLAEALRQLGDTRRARTRLQDAERLARASGTPSMRARVAATIGDFELLAGDARGAVARYSAVIELPLPEGHAVIARALVGRARAYRALGDLRRASADLERAARTGEANGNREELIAATAERAELAALAGDRATALALATRAVDDIRALTAGAADPESRITLGTRLRRARELRVQLLAEDALARLAAGDATRARELAFAALLATDAATTSTPSVAPGGARAAERTRVTNALAERRYRLQSLAERYAEPTPQMLALEREIAMLRTELTQLGAQADAPAPPAPEAGSTLAALARRVGAGDALLVYSLGATRSWLWVVSRERFDLLSLPPAGEIELHVERLLGAVRQLHAPRLARDAAARVADDVMPPAARLPGGRRLVVPDGALGAVPWSLLSAPGDGPVVQLASLQSVLGEPSPHGTWNGAAPLRIALFGDPVFDDDDARIAGGAAPSVRGELRGTRALPRLPGTAREVAAIAAMADAADRTEQDRVDIALGTDATRDRLLSLAPRSVDVLHLATHATLDTRVPALAALVLSRRDASGRELAGDVRPDDVLALRAAPKLVVLSACDAAAEPSRSAAGLMNLTRAFVGAGAQYVVASRWAVADDSAVALMTEFYRALLRDRLPPDVALARAQAALAANPKWSAPFYWAGFVVTGAAP
jgi:tetratricopeptide (TPR) repeat protein